MFYIELLNRLVLVLGHFLPILRLTLLFVSECVYENQNVMCPMQNMHNRSDETSTSESTKIPHDGIYDQLTVIHDLFVYTYLV